MDHAILFFKTVFAAAGGAVAFWLGGLDKLLIALVVMMGLEYVAGILRAWYSRALSSAVGFRGIAKKVMLLVVVAVAFVIEYVTEGAFPVREIVIIFFIANEGLSILENAAALGLPLPQKLREALAQIKGGDRDAEANSANQ